MKEKERSMFGEEEVNLIDKKTSDGNFHMRDMAMKEQYERSATEGHFAPLLRRIEKIDEALNDIINY